MVKKPPVTSHFACVPLGKTEGIVKEEGLAAYWKFDEGEGEIVKDSTGNGNDGVVHNAKWLNTSYGSALEFNGKDSAVEIPHPKENLAPEKEITVMGWFYYNERGQRSGLIWTYNYAYLLTAHVRFGAYGKNRNWYRTRFSAQYLTVPGWNHIAGTYDVNKGVKKGSKLYLNGEEKACYPYVAPINYGGDGKPWKWFKEFKLSIGASNFGTKWQESFNGKIDEVKIYNRALSGEEIKREFEKGKEAFSRYGVEKKEQ